MANSADTIGENSKQPWIHALVTPNDLRFTHFLIGVSMCQALVIAVLAAEHVGLHLHILRESLVFFYLTFVPGFVLLRILRIHGIGALQSIIYAVGLSLLFAMILGLAINTVLPQLGVDKPLSFAPTAISYVAGVFVLLLIAVWRDRRFVPAYVNTGTSILPNLPLILLLVLLPLASALGVRLMHAYHFNLVSLVVIFLLGALVLAATFERLVPRSLFPLVLYSTALSLIYMYSLTSNHVTGSDISWELYIAQLTQQEGYWNSVNPPEAYNALLSVTVLPTTYANMSSMSINSVFKIIYPLFFAFLPVALYEIYRRAIRHPSSDRFAFLAAAAFVFTAAFFSDFPWLAREQIGLLFVSLAILVLVTESLPRTHKTLLAIIFGASIVLSSYTITYLSLYYAGLTWLSLTALSVATSGPDLKLRERLARFIWSTQARTIAVSALFLFLLALSALSWYYFNADSAPLDSFFTAGHHMGDTPPTPSTPGPAPEPEPKPEPQPQPEPTPPAPDNPPTIFDPSTRDITILRLLGLVSMPSPVDQLQRVWFLVAQVLLLVGLGAALIFRRTRQTLSRWWLILGILSIVLLAISIIVPYFSTSIGMLRMYQITLLFLAPFLVIGGVLVIERLSRLVRRGARPAVSPNAHLAILTLIVLVPYLLLNTGFVHEVTRTLPASLPLGLNRMLDARDADVNRDSYGLYVHDAEAAAAQWLTSHRPSDSDLLVYTDEMYWVKSVPLVSYQLMHPSQIELIDENTTEVPNGQAYIFLGYINVVERRFRCVEPVHGLLTTFQGDAVLGSIEAKNKVYSSNLSEIYR